MSKCLEMNTFSLIYNENSKQHYKLISDCKQKGEWYISNNSKIIEVQDYYPNSFTQFPQHSHIPLDSSSRPRPSIYSNLSSSFPHIDPPHKDSYTIDLNSIFSKNSENYDSIYSYDFSDFNNNTDNNIDSDSYNLNNYTKISDYKYNSDGTTYSDENILTNYINISDYIYNSDENNYTNYYDKYYYIDILSDYDNISDYINFNNSNIISGEVNNSDYNYNKFENYINELYSDIFDISEIKYELNQKKEDLNFDEIINKVEIGKTYEFKGDDFLLIIKPTNSSYLENTTYVKFNQCENLLRKVLNISSSRILTFLQMEIYNNNEKSLVNTVEYQVYDDNKTLLDLSICNDTNIKIFYTVKGDQLNLLSYSSYKDLGIDILNINDSFFNDICHPFSDSKNDIVLKDRIKDIYQNYSLCDEGCIYDEFIYEYKTISCDCKVKTNISTNDSLSLNLK